MFKKTIRNIKIDGICTSKNLTLGGGGGAVPPTSIKPNADNYQKSPPMVSQLLSWVARMLRGVLGGGGSGGGMIRPTRARTRVRIWVIFGMEQDRSIQRIN